MIYRVELVEHLFVYRQTEIGQDLYLNPAGGITLKHFNLQEMRLVCHRQRFVKAELPPMQKTVVMSGSCLLR